MVCHYILLQLIFDILCYCSFITSHCVDIVPSAPKKCLLPYLYFRLACLSNIIKLLFPLRYPTNRAILKCGGILTSMWMWSRHDSASIIFTSFCSHHFLNISPIFFSVARISLSFCISVQILYDIHSDILNVPYFLFRSSFVKNLLVVLVMRSPIHYYFTTRRFLFTKVFSFPQ